MNVKISVVEDEFKINNIVSKNVSMVGNRRHAFSRSCLKGFCILISILFFSACKQGDEKKIIGKWKSDPDWFEFKDDKTYSSGKDMIKMVDHFLYTIDPKAKELNLYTDEKDRTYYLIYEFVGDDTLAVRNAMSSNKTMIKFYRVKNK